MHHFLSLQGYGTYFYSNSEVYEGGWSEDHRSGWGRMYYQNGDMYEGEWLKDKNHGQGIIRFGESNLLFIHFYQKQTYTFVGKMVNSENYTFQIVSQQMETGMKVPGKMAKRTVMEGSAILTKASFMKAFGWME